MISNQRKLILLLLVAIVAGTLSGCGSVSSEDAAVYTSKSTAVYDSPEEIAGAGDYRAEMDYNGEEIVLGKKLIHNLDYTILVPDPNKAVNNIIEKTNSLKGYLVESSLSANNGESSYARIVVKVPQDQMQLMTKHLESMGMVKNQAMFTEDVTSQYYDTEARLKVLQKEEERMLAFMDDESATIQDLLAIEREIAKVREQRESLQARMNVLKNQVSYAQFNINLQASYNEVTTPQGTASKAKATLINSINSMLQLFNWLVIAFFAILPYLILLGLGYGIFRAVKKRRAKKE